MVWLVIVVSIIVAVILALVAVVIIRTATCKSKQVIVKEKASYPIKENEAAARLSEAIRFKTVSNVDMSKIDHSAFRGFHEFLQKSFPLCHSKLEKKNINEYGLLFFWKGSDAARKPVLLMAHQDVVPATDQNWKYPAFSGAIEEGYIWGRGTLDDKGSLVAIMEAVEFLLREGYQPERSIYLAFGFDEEVGGREGARKIADYLRAQSVKFEYILDEGQLAVKGAIPGLTDWIALVGIADKGYLSLELSTEQKGGHASSPPPQTTVGVLSAAIVKLQDHPFPLRLINAVAEQFEYLAAEMRNPMKRIFANTWLFRSQITKTLAATPAGPSLKTTMAPTMISGSPQDNVLPMRATAVINFRLLQGDTIKSVMDRVTKLIADPRVKLAIYGNDSCDPSPVSASSGWAFETISRTVREVLGDALVTPTLVQAKTDTIHYTGLYENCYRFLPHRVPMLEVPSLHGLNERISVNNYVETINFYIRLLHNSCD